MIQFQSDPFNMIEASRLENMCRNKETLPTQYLTIPNTSNHVNESQKSWNLEDFLAKIQFHHKTLNLTNTNPLTNWQVFILMRLNLIMNVNPIPNLVIQFSFLNLRWLWYP